ARGVWARLHRDSSFWAAAPPALWLVSMTSQSSGMTARAKSVISPGVARNRARCWLPGLVGLFIVAAAWRLIFLDRLAHSPLAGATFDDARIYWAWSARIAQRHLVGTNPFFLAPLYPYVLGLLRIVVGNSPSATLVVQALWGAGAVTLLAAAAKRLTTASIGAVVGVMLCFYEMAVFFDGLFLAESLLFFLEA